MMMKRVALLCIAAGSLLLSACSSLEEKPQQEVPVEDHGTQAQGTGTEGAQADGAQVGGAFTGEALNDPNSPLSKRVIYFAFDSSDLTPEGQDLVSAHAKYLALHPDVSVVLEGHTDERGSREYNLALGERRAKAVERLMTLQGVAAKQLQVISFGEEHPVALGHDESAWRLNRRVELLYSGN